MAVLAAFVMSGNLDAQEADGIEAVMRFLGVDSPEELDSSEVERMEDFLE